MPYKIRQAISTDTAGIQTFYKDSLPLINTKQTSWIPGVYPDIAVALAAVSKQELFICIDEQDIVVGSMILNHNADEAYQELVWLKSEYNSLHLIVHTLISHPERLKQGIASQMIAFVKQYAAENDVFSIRLDTLVGNIPARKLYEKSGFAYIGRHDLPSFDNKGVDDCVFYEFKL